MAVIRKLLAMMAIALLRAPSPEEFKPQLYSTEKMHRMIAIQGTIRLGGC